MPTRLSALAPEIVQIFHNHGFHLEGIEQHLGAAGMAALFRGEPAAVRYAARGNSAIEQLIRLVLLRDAAPYQCFVDMFGEPLVQGLLDCDALLFQNSNTLQFQIDIRPHIFLNTHHWVFSDADAAMTVHIPGPDHVLGVGAASLSLVQASPTNKVSTVLDLGTGSGVQALAQSACAQHITAIDIHPRALEFAAASFAASNVAAELLCGPWFEPVHGRRFDRIVANPPFVVGLPEVGHIYRDSGFNLDGASELVISQAHHYLNPGGCAVMLAAWIHTPGESWQQRVASWLPDTGVAAWVIQRDIADPALYVGTWLQDESLDPRSIAAAARTEAWLEHFEQANVSGIGFGFVAIQRIDDHTESDILCEDMPQQCEGPLGEEITEYFARITWLRDADITEILETKFGMRPGVAVEEISVVDTDAGIGFRPAALRLTRTDGPRWSHDVDRHLYAIVSGLSTAGLSLGEIVELYCAAHDLDVQAMLPEVVGAIVDLIRHGFVLPSELIEL
ncbi:DUF7782 domain-containing protein [Corynebacterium freiburgense]|uniref:DUF7782 domain-containing protein n=1 Tax=Corynebacterium freiburgense TaxID=556548 RepID=UPI000423BC4B|nr:methyltransferase [Corynebacterium freiburgense]WJZ02866.1 N5-glutamine S-adenosyl-L-methionine-dependent methyltransferase [Corynebacterium freiburgense]